MILLQNKKNSNPFEDLFYIWNMDKLIPVVYMIGVLILVLPAFLQSNSKLKQFLKNLSIWAIIVIIIMTLIYMLN